VNVLALLTRTEPATWTELRRAQLNAAFERLDSLRAGGDRRVGQTVATARKNLQAHLARTQRTTP
jgi:hypothetical protein